MIEVSDAVMRGEETNLFAYPFERILRRTGIEITQRDRDVGRVSEFGCGNAGVFERVHQRRDLGVAGEIPRLQCIKAAPHFTQAQSKMIAPRIERMKPAG